MKSSRYIKSGLNLIQDDLETILLYYDYFSPGITFPSLLNFRFAKRLFHVFLRYVIVAIFFLRLHHLTYAMEYLDEDFLIRIQGRDGGWINVVELRRLKNGKLKIFKKAHSNEIFFKEKQYYEKHVGYNGKLRLPVAEFNESLKEIEIDFIRAKTLHRQIRDGTLSFKKMMSLFFDLKKEILVFYQLHNSELIHGDFSVYNLFYDSKNYFLIDYSDAIYSCYQFDLYHLLYSSLLSFGFIQEDNLNLVQDKIFRAEVLVMINATEPKMAQLVDEFNQLRKNKYPSTWIKK